MNSLLKICLLFVSFCAVFSETFTGNAAVDIPTQQAMSYQYSNMILEFQSLMAWGRAVYGWRAMTVSHDGSSHPTVYLEEDNDDDFVLEEDKVKQPESLEMWGAMGGMGMGGYATPDFHNSNQAQGRKIESETEYSILMYLKYLNLIVARKMEAAQNTHYQSRAVTSALQGLGAANPMASSLLYMLYYRDVLQTLLISQSVQRYDSWTLWNFLEIMETNEDPDRTHQSVSLSRSITTAYAIAMRIWSTEAMLDFQTFMLDYYLTPMLSQLAAPVAPAPVAAPAPAAATPPAFLEEEVTAQPEKPFFGAAAMSSPQYMVYYLSMFKFYAKYLLLTATQTLATEAGYANHPELSAEARQRLPQMKQYGLNSLQQWVQIKYFLLYFDMSMMSMAPGAPSQSFDGPAAHLAASTLVQTDDAQAQAEPRVQNPVIENQVPVAQPVQQLPQQTATRQSVVG